MGSTLLLLAEADFSGARSRVAAHNPYPDRWTQIVPLASERGLPYSHTSSQQTKRAYYAALLLTAPRVYCSRPQDRARKLIHAHRQCPCHSAH